MFRFLMVFFLVLAIGCEVDGNRAVDATSDVVDTGDIAESGETEDATDDEDGMVMFINPKLAFYAGRTGYLEATTGGLPLPDRLIIEPGLYEIESKSYELADEGLFRYSEFEKENLQRIVFDLDLNRLLSSFAWLASHGNTDQTLSDLDLNRKAMADKVYITCGRVSDWVKYNLHRLGYRSRIVMVLTLDDWNDYDNGHTMIEVEIDGRWVLYDIAANSTFTDLAEMPLNLIEFVTAVRNDAYRIVPIASDIRIDISGFKSESGFNMAFLLERTFYSLRDWYQRVAQVAIIDGFFYDDTDRRRVELYSDTFQYLEKGDFLEQFYY
jgi:hypothetical protein